MSPLPFSSPLRHATGAFLALGLAVLPSCVKEDEELQSQLIEARATVTAKTKALEEAAAQISSLQRKLENAGNSNSSTVVSTPPPSPSPSSGEIVKLKARISELESQAAAAARQASSGAEAPTRIDMDAMASKLEEDLTRKAKQLRELVQKQTPTGKIDEIGLKAIDYPPQIVTPFSSAITFSIVAENGQRLRLTFPVTADLGGAWKLPDPSAVRLAYEQAQRQSQEPLLAGGGVAASPVQPAPANSTSSTPSPAPQPQGGASGMRQVAPGVFEFSWGDGAQPAASTLQQRPAPAPAPQPQAPPVASNNPISNFSLPGPGAAAPAPGQGTPPAPPPAPQGPAAVPAPVMPVQQDITIRFD